MQQDAPGWDKVGHQEALSAMARAAAATFLGQCSLLL